MKASRYNFFIEEETGEILAYNALTGAFACIDRELYELFLKACTDLDIAGQYHIDAENEMKLPEKLRCFYDGGFFIEDGTDEFNILKNRQYQRRFMQNYLLTMTIAPTMDCNFDCIYCYEDKNRVKKYMDRHTADYIIKYIDGYFTNGGILNIAWFGGEPTLAPDIMYYISDAVKDIAAQKRIDYTSRIVTNGYLLDKKTALVLCDRGIRDACITIDGCSGAHNERRYLKNREGTFNTIIENIRCICDIMNVNIVFNTDKDNITEYEGLLDIFEDCGVAGKIKIGIVMTEAYRYSCDTVKRRALSTREFSEVYRKLAKLTVKRNFKMDLFPPANRSACSAVVGNNLVVGPGGELHKCLNTLGRDSEIYGNICSVDEQNSRMTMWMEYSPVENDKCRSCRIAPICMGGCSRNALIEEAAPVNTEGCCMQFKYNLEPLLKLKYLQHNLLKG